MAYQEQMLHRIQHCLRKWTMKMKNCHNFCPEDNTIGHTAPHNNLDQIAAHHTQEKLEFQGFASNAMAKAPIPTRGSAHPIPMRAEECLRAATHWLPKDLAMECQYNCEVLEAFLQRPNYAEKMQVNGTLSQKNHGENQNLLEQNMICIWQCWPSV